jgi:hypothetical protein
MLVGGGVNGNGMMPVDGDVGGSSGVAVDAGGSGNARAATQ